MMRRLLQHFRLRDIVAALALLITLAASIFAADRWVNRTALAESDTMAGQTAAIHAGLLSSELQKFRLLPLVLGDYPDVRAILGTPNGDPARLNAQLALFAERTGAAVIYVIRPDGRTMAASNYREATSFVGQDYGFRPYFRQALASGDAEMFGLGTISGRPGLFIARRVEGDSGARGVIVVKVEFDAVEAQWARQSGPTFVTDARGVVIITSRPEWRFRATRPLTAATRAAIRSTIQFGGLPLDALAMTEADGVTQIADARPIYRRVQTAVPLVGAQLSYFQPVAPQRARAAATARLAVFSLLVLSALAFAWSWRARVRQRALEEARIALEVEVERRTHELRDANALLVAESGARQATDRKFRAAREELAHANRLGSIGQITAGVTHEINQPVAAIQTFAENARKLIARGDQLRADANLAQIVGLTDRIGRITGELRGFARRGTPGTVRVGLDAAIEGTLLLVGDRIASAGAKLVRHGTAENIEVIADKIRLEQVLINLIHNAVEATADTSDPVIELRIDGKGTDTIRITVADNGPGVAPDIADEIFTPFVTGKRDGLGLGLGIARDIVREFGGRLESVASPLGGAAFVIHLKRAS